MNKKSKETILRMMLNLTLLLLAYGGFFREGFSGDAIAQKIWPLANIDPQVMNGRLLSYAIMMFLHQMGINPMYHYKVFYIIFMLIVAAAMCFVQAALEPLLLQRKNMNEETSFFLRIALCAVISLTYINGLFCENFMFPEWFLTFSLSYLLCAIGLWFIAKGSVWQACTLMLIAALFYQAQLIPTAIIAITIFFLQQDTQTGRLLIKSALMIVFCIGSILLIVRIGAIMHVFFPLQTVASKEVSTTDISLTILNLFRGVRHFCISGFGLLPPVFLPALVIILPLVLVGLEANEQKKKKRIIWLIGLSVVFYGLSFAIVAKGNAISMTGRLLGGLYAAQAMLLCTSWTMLENERKQAMVLGIGAVALLLQIVFCNMIMMNHYISNTLDLEYARAVYDQIRKYEKESGEEITTVAYARDAACMNSYDCVYYKFGEINVRSIESHGYALLRYVSMEDGREFEYGFVTDEIYNKFFAGRDWNSYVPQEQLVFRDGTMYWCVY